MLAESLLLAAQVDVKHLRETASARYQTDDPAIWVNPKSPIDSFILVDWREIETAPGLAK
ncbi:MAG: hypothetical protein NTW74_00715 [Acidobacteria bacterium]|nr:hypothetical protein [Acidobacteriota bacterium]